MKRIRLTNPFNELYRECGSPPGLARNLNLVIAAAAIGLIYFTQVGGTAAVGFATALGSDDFIFGLIFAIPVFASITQFFASSLVDKTGKHKKIFLFGGIIQRSIWLIVAWLPYIIPEVAKNSRIWFYITLLTASSIAGTFSNAGFYGFFTDLVPEKIRGRYISLRSVICTAVSMLSGLLGAWLLDTLPGFAGYTLLFSIASVFGVADIAMFFWIDIPPGVPVERKKAEKKEPLAWLKMFRDNPKLTSFVLFWGLWTFAMNFTAPFFSRYAIDVQKLTFTQIIMFGQIPANIMSMLFLPFWGRMLDKYGSKPVLSVTCMLTAIFVLVWIPAVPGSILSLFLFNFFGGIYWCGTDITSQSMMLSHTPKVGKNTVISTIFVVNAVASAIAVTLGGALLKYTSPLLKDLHIILFSIPLDHYKLLFVLGVLIRLLPPLFVLPHIENEREYKSMAIYEACGTWIRRIFMSLRRAGR